jgi:hypothetical protein
MGHDRVAILRDLFQVATKRFDERKGWDPRWRPLILAHVGEPNEGWASHALSWLPKLGPEALPFLLRDLDLSGTAADTRRWNAIVAIDREAGLDRCRKAVVARDPEARAQALKCLASAAPVEAEHIARNMLRAAGPTLPAVVRTAAMACLRSPVEDDVNEPQPVHANRED